MCQTTGIYKFPNIHGRGVPFCLHAKRWTKAPVTLMGLRCRFVLTASDPPVPTDINTRPRAPLQKGSHPKTVAWYNAHCGPLAQLAEQGTFNPKAQGSNP